MLLLLKRPMRHWAVDAHKKYARHMYRLVDITTNRTVRCDRRGMFTPHRFWALASLHILLRDGYMIAKPTGLALPSGI